MGAPLGFLNVTDHDDDDDARNILWGCVTNEGRSMTILYRYFPSDVKLHASS